MHGGEGLLRVKFFGFDNAARPNLFISYVIPPGCSEGVHTHRLGDRELGAYDEFYYVLAGSGLVQLGSEQIAVAAGDHVFAPLGMPHGVANPSGEHELKLLLTAVERG
jgi:mannose-6-phosphate isomerase-like protein (cupin superfamily)